MSLGGQLGNPLGKLPAVRREKDDFDLARINLLRADVIDSELVNVASDVQGTLPIPRGTVQCRLTLWNWGGHSFDTNNTGSASGGSALVQSIIAPNEGDELSYFLPRSLKGTIRAPNATVSLNGSIILSAEAGEGLNDPGSLTFRTGGSVAGSIGQVRIAGENGSSTFGGAAARIGPFAGGPRTTGASRGVGGGCRSNVGPGGLARLIAEFYGTPL